MGSEQNSTEELSFRDRYRLFAEKEADLPIFSRPWWLDVMCGPENWDAYLVGKGNDIKASLVYYFQDEQGARRIKRALLTQNNGIYVRYPKGQGLIARQKYEEKIVDEILDHIESLGLASYDQQYNWHYKNYLPFFWRYYKEATKYTYVIEDTSDMAKVRAEYSADVRNLMRKAQKTVYVTETISEEEFYRVNSLTFERQGITIPYTFEQFSALYHACLEHHAGKLLAAADEEGRVHSVAMIVWDDNYVYFLLNGTDPELKMSQSNYLLIDACIEEASKLQKAFDFEGSVIRQVNHAFREFGGMPMPYFRITKDFS